MSASSYFCAKTKGMDKLVFVFFFIFFPIFAFAQRRATVVNMETGVPIRDVKIYTNKNETFTTNWRGEFFVPFNATSMTISHGKFLPITLSVEELTDTIYMLPKLNWLSEVTVWGKRPQLVNSKISAEEAKALTPGPAGIGVTFDFFSLFKKKPMNKKQREKHQWIIDNY